MPDEPVDIVAVIAEQRIREAIERGEFDNLPGRGRPLPLDDMEGVPAPLRAAYRLLKQNGLVPPEVEASKEIARLEEALAATLDPGERASLEKALAWKRITYDVMLQRWRREAKH